jgi:hypothetical protein
MSVLPCYENNFRNFETFLPQKWVSRMLSSKGLQYRIRMQVPLPEVTDAFSSTIKTYIKVFKTPRKKVPTPKFLDQNVYPTPSASTLHTDMFDMKSTSECATNC